MPSAMISERMPALLLISLVLCWMLFGTSSGLGPRCPLPSPFPCAAASPPVSGEEGAAELELLFDPGLLQQRDGVIDEYGERPLPPPPPPPPPPSSPPPPPPPPDVEYPYQPNLEEEYY
ncbi:uncharacterized protein ACO6RY_11793 [Pungitius sinensis]